MTRKNAPLKLKSLMEDLNLYGETQDKSEVKLTPEQKQTILAMVKDFNQFGKYLQREKSLTDIAKKLSQICTHADTLLTSEEGDWFDKNTVQRHSKELKKYTEDFVKVATEANLLEQRMLALFEDLGNILNKYFKIEDKQVDIPKSVGGDTPAPPSGGETATAPEAKTGGSSYNRQWKS